MDFHISDVTELVALLPVLTSLISDGCMWYVQTGVGVATNIIEVTSWLFYWS